MASAEEYDWIFDFMLQFIESEKFDAAMMDFIDEKCEHFDNDEENKFIYTTIHNEFREHVESLIESNLGELGLNLQIFLEACEKSRNGRDVNALVFERLIAMEDFETFKKLMIKRNYELQLEVLQSFKKRNTKTSSPVVHYSPGGDSRRDHDHKADSDDDDKQLVSHTSPQFSPKISYKGNVSSMNEDSRRRFEEDFAHLEELEQEMERLATRQRNNDIDKSARDAEIDDLERQAALLEDELEQMMIESYLEMEILHRQVALEQAELERAMQMSLCLEEERLSFIRAELKRVDNGSDDEYDSKPSQNEYLKADQKSVQELDNGSKSSTTPSSAPLAQQHKSAEPASDAKKTGSSSSNSTTAQSGTTDIYADPKPLKIKELKPLGALGGGRPLGPIGSGGATPQAQLSSLNDDLREKEKLVEKNIKKNQEEASEIRRKEEELAQKMNSEEAERRAKHMKEQREKILAAKKAEREKKIRAEEKEEGKMEEMPEAVKEALAAAATQKKKDDAMLQEEEQKKAKAKLALARKLKMDLMDSDELQGTEGMFEKQLELVESNREENRRREAALLEKIKRQEALLQTVKR